ncbi:hypothetical protein EVAR_21657_1 [Eumeta japonica]|uniref:Uncharacterized protein n=1 Tax=Eumeta variegata TaxID=151549 RepID=A0A4C1VIT4_EUMVA|nr:hypothetical protein EVAR_21657_1 [Eumeta japonica]
MNKLIRCHRCLASLVEGNRISNGGRIDALNIALNSYIHSLPLKISQRAQFSKTIVNEFTTACQRFVNETNVFSEAASSSLPTSVSRCRQILKRKSSFETFPIFCIHLVDGTDRDRSLTAKTQESICQRIRRPLGGRIRHLFIASPKRPRHSFWRSYNLLSKPHNTQLTVTYHTSRAACLEEHVRLSGIAVITTLVFPNPLWASAVSLR